MANVNTYKEYHVIPKDAEGPDICDSLEHARKVGKSKSVPCPVYEAITTYQLVDIVYGDGTPLDESFTEVQQKGKYRVKEG